MRTILFTVFLAFNLLSCKEKGTYIIDTDHGKMTVKLLESTPQHKANFEKLVSENFYDHLLFHRVISGFMIQGGDPESKNAPSSAPLGSGGLDYLIPAEIGTPHFRGMLAAARQGDAVNPEKKSSACQFYIVQGQTVTDQELDAIEASKGFKYSAAQREKYKKLGGTPMLDGDYTVFGEVIEGLDVIDKIANVEKDNRDRPVKDVKMKIY
jgi:cyclophilin family peptidyl-prolyl cis-trans isomerase